MTKCWIVEHRDYDGDKILGVYTSLSAAKERAVAVPYGVIVIMEAEIGRHYPDGVPVMRHP